jgi:predicted O-linked N-acetylglucosamine transferase (SPINDLY family)
VARLVPIGGMSDAPTAATLREAARKAEANGDLVAAERDLRQALAIDPGDGNSVFTLAEFLSRRGRYAEAEPFYETMLAAFPNEPALLNSVAVLRSKTGREAQAIELWRKLHADNPTMAQPLVNIGLTLRAAGETTAAVEHFQQALAVDPGLFEAHYNLGVTWYHAKRLDAAIASLEAALNIRPNHIRARVQLAQAAQAVCDWDRFESLLPLLQEEVGKAMAGRPCAVTPWFSLRLPISRAQRKAVATLASLAYEAAAPAPGFSFRPAPKDRLTIGYISGDFRDHPILQLTAGLYRRHNRARFKTVAYPVKPADAAGTVILHDGCDAVVDLTQMSDLDAARRVYADGVDILVDISGFNTFMRPTILAFRPAPIQVSYLNFAGTLSHRLYDYIIADPIVIPAEHESDYLETVARVSQSYQINNCDQLIDAVQTRETEGLPEDAFVFACFCANEKIEREVFGLWMEILREIPRAVLWLFGESPIVQINLRRAAADRGIAPERLIFARRRPKSQHLGRIALADLHFDTGTYGAHTTGSDALWAGVPLVTRIGDTFPARVGASLLEAVGLPELVARDWEEYRHTALDLARQPARLAALRKKLAETRGAAPLFNTDQSVRELESLYEKMWAARLAGLPPAPIRA